MKDSPSLVATVSYTLRVRLLGRETQGAPAQGEPGPFHVLGRFHQSPHECLRVLAGAHGGATSHSAHFSQILLLVTSMCYSWAVDDSQRVTLAM